MTTAIKTKSSFLSKSDVASFKVSVHKEVLIPSVIDLCCGLGGLSLAAKELGMNVVAGVDLNLGALKTFSKNFPEAQAIEGSVRSKKVLRLCKESVQNCGDGSNGTLILSGPPCQGFSMAGPRKTSDPRNQVLIGVARAIANLQPDCAIVENVSMILSKKNARRLSKFKNILLKSGYSITTLLLDASEFGVSQKRKRAFFLITRIKINKDDILKFLETFKMSPKTATEAFQGLSAPSVRPKKYNDETDYGLVFNHLAMRHSPDVMKKIDKIKPGSGPMSYRRLHPDQPSNTLFSGHRAPPAHFKEPRSITVREAARLQGIPDYFRIYGSFGNQMQQVTNAVPPPLAKVVLSVLVNFLNLSGHQHV